METNLVVSEGFGFERGHMDLFVTFALLAKRAVRQLATLVGHEVAPLREGQVVEVQKLSGGHALWGGGGEKQNNLNKVKASRASLNIDIVLVLHRN